MILRDPVHGLVAFEGPKEQIVEALMDTPEVQRLRRIRQLGVAFLAFPGAEHSRFVHAIGSAFVMKKLLVRLRALQDALPVAQHVTLEMGREALAAAFLHDLGHGPLSHLFEESIPGVPAHETWTERIVLDPSTGVHEVLARVDPGLPRRVADLVQGRHPLAYLAKAVSGEFDVDRCDYLLRDAHATGVRYGLYDLDWLLRSLRFAPRTHEGSAPALAIDGAKGLPAIEGFITARLFMFQQVYLHKATRSAEWMIRTILGRAVNVMRTGVELPSTPAAVSSGARRDSIALGDYLDLDDGVLWGAIRAWEDAKDRPLADLSKRIRARSLFKTIELFGDQATPEGRAQVLAIARDIARSRGFEPDTHVGIDIATDEPFAGGVAPFMVVYAKGPARPLHEVSFLLGRLAGQVLSRSRLVLAPELRDAVTDALGL
jgi:HD superfamily phosphohydrolase